MKKKTICLVLASLMLLSTVLSGCGSTNGEESKVNSAATQESSVAEESKVSESVDTEPELEEVTIQMMMIGPGPQEDTEKVIDAFNEMLQEYVPNTTVEFTPIISNEYKDSFNRMLATGEPVDLAWVGYLTSLQQDQVDGNLMPLDDLLKEYGQGIVNELGADVLDKHRYTDGELYYVFSWQGLYDNKYGFQIPKEFAELTEKTYPNWLEETRKILDHYWNEETTVENLELCFDQFEKYYEVLKANGKLYGGHAGKDSLHQFAFAPAAEAYITPGNSSGVMDGGVTVHHGDETFTVVDSHASEYMKAYYRRMAEWYQKGYIREDVLSTTYKEVKNGEWDDTCVVMKLHNLKNEDELMQYEVSKGVELEGIEVQRRGGTSIGSSTGMAIPYCADEPERAMMVLNALYTVPELYQLLVYGIEGEHYSWNDNGTITHVGLNSSSSPYGLANWFVGTCKYSLPETEGKIHFYDNLLALEKEAYENPFISFVFDKTAVSDAISALSALDKEYQDVLRLGVKGADWEAYYNEFIAARKAAGVDKVIEEVQKQLDEYIKENNITGLWWD